MSIFSYQTDEQNNSIDAKMMVIDTSIIPTVLLESTKNRNIKELNNNFAQNPTICKKLMKFFQDLKMAYESYAQNRCRCASKITWDCAHKKITSYITFKNSIDFHRFMTYRGPDNSYMQFLSYSLGNFLQKQKLALSYLSNNKQPCLYNSAEWISNICKNNPPQYKQLCRSIKNGQFCGFTNPNQQLELYYLFKEFGI